MINAKPQVFLRSGNVAVYHVYKCDDVDTPPRKYHYTTDPVEGSDDQKVPGVTFDVRELSTWVEPAKPPFLTGDGNTPENERAWDEYHKNKVEEKAIRKAIREAIAKGEVKNPSEE